MLFVKPLCNLLPTMSKYNLQYPLLKILKLRTPPYTDGDQDSHPYIRTFISKYKF